MILLTAAGTVGVLFAGPFIAVAIYYLFAVLRPQWLWRWALPSETSWSEYRGVRRDSRSSRLISSNRSTDEHKGQGRFVFGHAAVLAYAAWIVLTYITSQNRVLSWPWFLEYLKILGMFSVAAIVVSNARQVWILYLIATGSLIYIAYELNFLYFTAGRLDIYRNGYGGLDNNGAGLMVAMGLPLTIYAWEATRQWWRWIFAAAVPLLIHAVLMSYSRGAMVALLATAPLLMFRSRRRWQFLAMAIAIGLVVPPLAGREIRERFFSIENYETDRTANSRIESWKAAIQIANEYPAFGVGIRNANRLSYYYGADLEGRTIHSQYLQTLADTGYPGLALYMLLLVSGWTAIFRARRALKSRRDPDALLLRSVVGGLEGALAVFCIGASFLSLEVFELPYLLILLGVQTWVLAKAAKPLESPAPAVEADSILPAPSTGFQGAHP